MLCPVTLADTALGCGGRDAVLALEKELESDPYARVAAIALAVTFGWAAVAKLARFGSWRSALAAYRLSRGVYAAGLVAVPVAEGAVALSILSGLTRPGAALAIALLSTFTAAIARARAITGDRVPCGCFGALKDRDYRLVLARNALLGVAAGVVVIRAGDGTPLDGLAVPRPSEIVPAVLVVAGIGLILWLLSQVGTWSRGESR